GSKLVFARATSATASDLYTIGADGTGLTKVALPPPAPPTGDVQVVTTAGAAVRTIPDTIATAVGLSGELVAALVGNRILVYDTGSGKLVRSFAAAGAPSLAISGERIVFSRGSEVYLANVTTGRVSRLAAAVGKPIGLSIQGTRVAWGQ